MSISRRRFLKVNAAATLAASALPLRAAEADIYRIKNNRINQSVIPWCFKGLTAPQLIDASVRIGLKSVELIGQEHWPLLKQKGLTCAIAGSHGFAKGFAHTDEHEQCLASLRKNIDAAANAGVPSIITFSGFRRGLSDEAGTRNMVDGLKKIAAHAEQKKVTVCLEMLNSRVATEMKGHPDYFCDDIDKSVEICKRVSSERVKVLFDIYHVQIMNGDVITRIKQHKDWIGHYHTAGVPGRNEIDHTQEINYPPIMKAIVETGYKGYVGQEFIPLRDPMPSLAESARICDV